MGIRKFYGRDFEAVSKLVGNAWYASHGTQALWFGSDELCRYLIASDCGFVFVGEDDVPLGVALVESGREEDVNSAMRAVWHQQRLNIDMMARALEIDLSSEAPLVDQEERMLKEATEKFGKEGVGVLYLLVVAPEAQGRGVGRELMRNAMAWLGERGIANVRLATADDCDWQVYERWGLGRVSDEESPTDPGFHSYVYQGCPRLDG